MKRHKILFAVGLILAMVFAMTAFAQKEESTVAKGKQTKMSGTLSCTFCKMAHADKVCKKECCVGCIEAGSPSLLTTDDGEMYVLMANEIKKPFMTEERKEMIGSKVNIEGVVVKGKGVQVIYVDSVVKVEEKAAEADAADETNVADDEQKESDGEMK